MAVQNFNRKILDVRRWAMLSSLSPVASAAGACVGSSRMHKQSQLFLFSNTVAYLCDPFEDGFVAIPSPGLGGTFGVGATVVGSSIGVNGTATAGSTTTLSTNLNLARRLKGYKILITGGPGAGDVRTIATNTIGANGVITVEEPFSTALTTASTYRLLTPRWYVLGAGTLAATSFRCFDFATNAWLALTNTGLPATWGTDGRLIATSSFNDSGFAPLVTGTSTGANTTTTLANTGKAWTVNQFANQQVRIVSGTGAGQIRTITSNTATVLTVSTAWTTTPDATSVYSIEGNDDYLYLVGNGAVTLYRYSISANTWTTLAPTVARAGAPGAGLGGNWISDVTDPLWNDENALLNGRRIYSFRGAGSNALDYYDIALNAWTNIPNYGGSGETFNVGTKYTTIAGEIYIHKDTTGRWFKFIPADNAMTGWGHNVYPSGAAVVGDTCFDIIEPETGVRFVYMLLNTSTILMRCMVI